MVALEPVPSVETLVSSASGLGGGGGELWPVKLTGPTLAPLIVTAWLDGVKVNPLKVGVTV